MKFKNNKKGVTPIIAIILLLIMTISAAGAAFYWLNLIEGKLKVQENINVKEFGGEGNVSIIAANYDAQLDQLILFLENKGSVAIPIKTSSVSPTTVWVLKDEKSAICSTDWSGADNGPVCVDGCKTNLAAGELRRITLENLNSNSLCNVQDQQPGSLIFYTIDFSGKAVATGGFVR